LLSTQKVSLWMVGFSFDFAGRLEYSGKPGCFPNIYACQICQQIEHLICNLNILWSNFQVSLKETTINNILNKFHTI
jgi:hypothetical protein